MSEPANTDPTPDPISEPQDVAGATVQAAPSEPAAQPELDPGGAAQDVGEPPVERANGPAGDAPELPPSAAPPTAAPAKGFVPPELTSAAASAEPTALDLLDDVELQVKVELGRADMYIEEVLRLGAGAVVELDRLAGDPVDVYVNERLVARGEVLVLNDSFCVRVNEIVAPLPDAERKP